MNAKLLEKIEPLLDKVNEKNLPYILLGVVVFILVLDYMVILGPQLSSLSKISPKIKTAADDLKTTKDNIEKMSYYTGESSKLKLKFDQISGRVQSRVEVPLALERISRLALKNNIKIDEITPDHADQKELLKEKDRIYYSLPITLQIKGDFHNFGRFLNQIEKDDVILMVGSMKILPRGEGRQSDIQLTLDAVIYDQTTSTK